MSKNGTFECCQCLSSRRAGTMADAEKRARKNKCKGQGSAEVFTKEESSGTETRRGESNCGRDKRVNIDNRKLAQLAEAFQLFDFDRDGIITLSDLKKVYVSLGKLDVDDEQIRQMIAESHDPLDLKAFIKLMGSKTLDLDDEQILSQALSKWDYGNGLISEARIRHDLMTWGDRFTEDEVERALEHAPAVVVNDTETMIDYAQFCNDLCGFRRAKALFKGK